MLLLYENIIYYKKNYFCAAYLQLQVDNEHAYEQPVSINE